MSSAAIPQLPGPVLPRGRSVVSSFYARTSDAVARDLIGKILWRDGVGGGRLTEVEAYLPRDDPASHSFRGRTKRNGSMFGPPGSIYVYLSYGVHVLLNIVCDAENVGAAVLIRSFEPMGDTTVLRRNRGGDFPSGRSEILRSLACGPGRVGRALGLHLAMDGLALGADSGLWVFDDGARPQVCEATRVGISKGAQMPLRYLAAGSRYVT